MTDTDQTARNGTGRWALVASAVLFALFVANLFAGKFGGAPFLGDVAEAVLLFFSVASFVVGILDREAAATRQ
jgi:hypothetical protein